MLCINCFRNDFCNMFDNAVKLERKSNITYLANTTLIFLLNGIMFIMSWLFKTVKR